MAAGDPQPIVTARVAELEGAALLTAGFFLRSPEAQAGALEFRQVIQDGDHMTAPDAAVLRPCAGAGRVDLAVACEVDRHQMAEGRTALH